MRNKLDTHLYTDVTVFQADFKQIIKNCNTFNPPGSVAQDAARRLNELFDKKWKALFKGKPLTIPRRSTNDNSEVSSAGGVLRATGKHNYSCGTTLIVISCFSLPQASPLTAASPALPPRSREPSVAVQPPPPVLVPPRRPATSKDTGTGLFMPSVPKKPTANRAPPPIHPPDGDKPDTSMVLETNEPNKLSFDEQFQLARAIHSLSGPDLEKALQLLTEGAIGIPRLKSKVGSDISRVEKEPLSDITYPVWRRHCCR